MELPVTGGEVQRDASRNVTKFAIVDMVVTGLPNVKSIVFKEQEGSYLAGVMAAIAAKSCERAAGGTASVSCERRREGRIAGWQ